MQIDSNLGSSTVFYDQKKLIEDIKFMVLTPRNSILGYPEYGSDVLSMLYKQGTRANLDLVSSAVYDVLSKFSGVSVINVSSSLSSDKKSAIVKYDIIYNSVKISNDLIINMEV